MYAPVVEHRHHLQRSICLESFQSKTLLLQLFLPFSSLFFLFVEVGSDILLALDGSRSVIQKTAPRSYHTQGWPAGMQSTSFS